MVLLMPTAYICGQDPVADMGIRTLGTGTRTSSGADRQI